MNIVSEMPIQADPSSLGSVKELEDLWEKAWPANLPRELRFPHGRRAICDYLREWAKVHPEKPAIIYYGRIISFGELDTLSDKFASLLLANGVKKGDRVAVLLQNCPQFSIAFYGILKAGAVYTPISPMSKTFELSHQLMDSGARVIVAQDQLIPLVRQARKTGLLDTVFVTSLADVLPATPELPLHADIARDRIACADAIDLMPALAATPVNGRLPSIDVNDLAALNYTGGTTGMPKGCMHTHFNMLYTGAAGRFAAQNPSSELPLVFVPQFWIAGENTSLVAPMIDGNTIVLLTRWDAQAVLKAVELYGVTQLSLPVDAAIELIDRPDFSEYNLSSLRSVRAISLIRKLTIELRRRWEEATGLILYEASYGMTETHTSDSFTLGMQGDDFDLKARPTFVGLPVPGTKFKIVDFETGVPLPIGSEGEICVLTPSATKGYWSNSEATGNLIRNGWIHTGDIGMFNEQGHLHYLGRRKEMIKVKGMSVFPAEIEAILRLHPAVLNVAVVPRTDADKGQVPVAFVIPRNQVEVDELRTWCKDRLSTFKVPEVRLVTEFPMTGTGKIKKAQLAELADQAAQ
ncbi:AMP-binding protein [Microvirga zambiensis]|uniref:AMP-binding protein n=1 Tax=Microvirga zambiensis TaxID=1402137 RepID=UPI001FE7D7C8|nr:AMP-binding protein [Microvirga zambiensis]